jgi:hypothetical protein
MQERFDPLFPEAGGMAHLADIRGKWASGLPDRMQRAPRTFFHPDEIGHIRKALAGLGDDGVAKATLMSYLAFAQMKSDVAGF